MNSLLHPHPPRVRSLTPCGPFLTALAALGLVLSTGGTQAQEPVPLPLGSTFQQIVDEHPPGTTYLVRAGIHRAQAVIPKDGDVIIGEPGAVLNGSLLLQNWQQDGEWWIHEAPVVLPDYGVAAGVGCNTPICRQGQDLYVDDQRLDAVTSPDLVTNSRLWYLDKEARRVMVKFDPREADVEFGGPAVTAINCLPLGRPDVLGVVIKDLTIEKYPSPPQVGAVQFGGGGEMRNCTVRYAHGYGIGLRGPTKLIECRITNNGLAGIGGSGAGSLIYKCEIDDNIWSYYSGLAWDAGGVKLANTRYVVFRNNYIHHNHGIGLWTDIKTHDVLHEENIVELNEWEGILPELSNHITIRRNICRWNGTNPRNALWGGQVCVQNSSHILLDSNYLETGPGNISRWGNPQGFMAFNQDHRVNDEIRFGGSFGVRNITVRDNLFLMPKGGTNGLEYGKLGWPTYADFLNAGISWRDNRYLIGRPLFLQWAWWPEENWPKNSAVGLRWEEWSQIQDTNSTIATFGPDHYQPTSTSQHALIKEITGLDYLSLKASITQATESDSTDSDEDGLPDEWEWRYFGSRTAALPDDDGDGDGLSNAQEFAAQTDPRLADTDEDRLPDGWEITNKLNPLVYDSEVDLLGDGRSAREVYEDRLFPAGTETLASQTLQSAISIWLATSSGLTVQPDATVTSWQDQGPSKLNVTWPTPPSLEPASPPTAGLVNVTNTFLQLPGQSGQWGQAASGFSVSFVFQPTELDVSRTWRALLSNEVYLQTGFRLRLESGYLVWSSGQNGGSLGAEGHTRLLPNQTYVITLLYGGQGRTSSIYVNGKPEIFSVPGVIVPSSAPLRLCGTSGMLPQPGRFGDVAVFNRLLSHQERRFVEGLLTQKFVTGVPEGTDRDNDGLPDAWESSFGLDPLTPNALTDEDRDGATNLTEFQLGLNPTVSDTDRDGMPDGWEVRWGTDPLVADAEDDPDGDGLSNLDEFRNGTDPKESNLDPPFLSFQQRRLWWRADHGLTVADLSLGSWSNSTPEPNGAKPQDNSAPVPLAEEFWRNTPVLQLSENAVLSTSPIDPRLQFHAGGLTLNMVVRPPQAPTPAGFRRLLSLGNAVIGVQAGTFVLRNESGSIATVSSLPVPSDAFVLSYVHGSSEEVAQLLVNGVPAVEIPALAASAPVSLALGGPDAWPADVAEVIVHSGLLTPLARRFAERVLQGKWLGTGPLAGDADSDGLPDWWEHEACTDASTADADADADWNGETNRQAYEAGRPGFVWLDADADGMHDGWERFYGLDPTLNDADLDPDHDEIANALEYALLSSPQEAEPGTPWSISLPSPSPDDTIRLRLRTSQRSWAQRARWETSTSLEPGTWEWLNPGTLVESGPGATAWEETEISSSLENGRPRSLLRLRLHRD